MIDSCDLEDLLTEEHSANFEEDFLDDIYANLKHVKIPDPDEHLRNEVELMKSLKSTVEAKLKQISDFQAQLEDLKLEMKKQDSENSILMSELKGIEEEVKELKSEEKKFWHHADLMFNEIKEKNSQHQKSLSILRRCKDAIEIAKKKIRKQSVQITEKNDVLEVLYKKSEKLENEKNAKTLQNNSATEKLELELTKIQLEVHSLKEEVMEAEEKNNHLEKMQDDEIQSLCAVLTGLENDTKIQNFQNLNALERKDKTQFNLSATLRQRLERNIRKVSPEDTSMIPGFKLLRRKAYKGRELDNLRAFLDEKYKRKQFESFHESNDDETKEEKQCIYIVKEKPNFLERSKESQDLLGNLNYMLNNFK